MRGGGALTLGAAVGWQGRGQCRRISSPLRVTCLRAESKAGLWGRKQLSHLQPQGCGAVVLAFAPRFFTTCLWGLEMVESQ